MDTISRLVGQRLEAEEDRIAEEDSSHRVHRTRSGLGAGGVGLHTGRDDATRLLEQAHAQTKVQEAEEDEEPLYDDEVIVEEDPAMQASREISALGT